MLRIISGPILDTGKQFCLCFIYWQKEFDCADWSKSMHILKKTGIDWRERNVISKLYMDEGVKIRLDQVELRSVKTGRRVKPGCCLSPILFNLYSEYLTKRSLEELGDLRTGGQVVGPVKYANNGQLAKHETVIQGMIDRLIEFGRCYEVERSVEKD